MVFAREGEPLSNVDAAWLRMEDSTNLMTITALLTFGEKVDLERLKEIIEDRFLIYDRFRQTVVEPKLPLAKPMWVEDEYFSLRAHVHRVALPAPGDKQILQEMVSDLMSTPLNRLRPLWQIHLIEGYGDGMAILVRIHHCIADGIALVKVCFSLTDEQPDEVTVLRPKPPSSRRQRSGPAALLSEGVETLLDPARMVELARSGSTGAAVVRKLLALPLDPPTVYKGQLGIFKKAVWSAPVPLADIKRVGKAFAATVNDVLLSAVSGALRRYALAQGDEIEGADVKAVVPVNLRRAEPDDQQSRLGNRFGLVFVPLPVGIGDPLERLAEVKKRMDEIKGSPQAGVAFGLLGLLGMAGSEAENVAVGLLGSKATLVLTNVPGPAQPLFLAGSPIRNMMFWVPQSARLGLGISIFSYSGEVRVGVASDAGLVPDPETITEYFDLEASELVRQTGA